MASSVSTLTSPSDVASVPPSTPTRATSASASANASASTSTNAIASANHPSTSDPASSSSSSYLKRTVVTAKRKEELLREARAERKRWIRTIPLPYDPNLLSTNANHTTDEKTKDDATNRLWSSREGLDQFQSSLVFRGRLLQGATAILSELYGIGSNLDDGNGPGPGEEKNNDESDGNGGGEGGKNRRKYLPNRPLSVDDIADRVDRFTKPFLVDEENEWYESSSSSSPSPTSIGDKKNDDSKPDNTNDRGGGTQGDGKQDARDNSYKDVRTAYEEFTDAMLLPEAAVTVQGMKNFVRQFAAVADSKKNDDDDDKIVRNMASGINGQIRSSYKSLAANNNSSNNNNNNTNNKTNIITSDAQGQGLPDWDRRSLESFLYGQVKTSIDTTLDRILGNTAAPPSPSSPFLMTQSSFDTRLGELQFLQPSHLELACLNDDSDDITPQTKLESLLEDPIKALQSIEFYYSPYEKLCRVLDIYHGVNAVLKKASKALPMADDIISAMILVIVKAAAGQTKSKPNTNTKASLKNLLRDLHFVENFALQEYKRVGGGEVEYAFTSLYGAVYFVQGVELDYDREENNGGNKASSNRLCISNEELCRGLERSRTLAAKNNTKQNAASGGGDGDGERRKGLISRGVDELLGGSDPSGIGSDGTEASNYVPTSRHLSVREVSAARLRGEIPDLQWALSRREGGQLEHEQISAQTKTMPSSPIKSPSKSAFVPQRYTFLGVRPDSIKLSDLPRLLDEYRKLVLSNEQLLGEHQRANNKVQLERKRLRDEKHRRTLGEQALLF